MENPLILDGIILLIALYLIRKIQIRLRLSRAKHPSLAGHAKMSRRVARLVPFYEFSEDKLFSADGAPTNIAQQRKTAFERLAKQFRERSPNSVAMSESLEDSISDVLFTNC